MRTFENAEQLRVFIEAEILFASEAAKYLGITTQRLNQLVHSKKIEPIKSSRSGSLFLKSDLDARKAELSYQDNYLAHSKVIANLGFLNKTDVLQEAINYFTIQSFYNYSDKKTCPVFSELSRYIDITEPLIRNSKEIERLINVSSLTLEQTYFKVLKGFEKLSDQDYIIKRGEQFYPELLSRTEEAPPFLFMRGNIKLVQYPTIAVVGSRNASEDGLKKAYALSRLLGKRKIVVASGLARGIDTEAHKGALDFGNPTIAVIGTPLNKVYPKENAVIQQQISENGLVISQFPPSSDIHRWHFPMRNAIMSGISLATVIVEAGETSGALKQADYALKQKRLVFIPQSALNNEKLSWPKKYIKREGAEDFSKIDDLMLKLEQAKVLKPEEVNEQIDLFDGEVGSRYVYRGQ